MTRISPSSPVRRETAAEYRGRTLVIELHPGYLTVGEKRKKTRVSVDYRTVYELGWKLVARAEAAQRKEKKGGRK